MVIAAPRQRFNQNHMTQRKNCASDFYPYQQQQHQNQILQKRSNKMIKISSWEKNNNIRQKMKNTTKKNHRDTSFIIIMTRQSDNNNDNI